MPARASLLALGAGGALAQGDDVDLLDVERELARLETGEVEQVADQPLQAAGLRKHDLERRLPLVLAVDHAVGDRLDVALDGSQRRAQLVRDAHQEVALVLARLLELARHLLEAVRELAELVRALGAQVHVVVAERDALAGLGQLAHRARDAPAEQQRDERRGRQGQQQRRHEAAPLHERRGVDRAHRARDDDRADQRLAVAEAGGGGDRGRAVGKLQVERLRLAFLAQKRPVEALLGALRRLAEVDLVDRRGEAAATHEVHVGVRDPAEAGREVGRRACLAVEALLGELLDQLHDLQRLATQIGAGPRAFLLGELPQRDGREEKGSDRQADQEERDKSRSKRPQRHRRQPCSRHPTRSRSGTSRRSCAAAGARARRPCAYRRRTCSPRRARAAGRA